LRNDIAYAVTTAVKVSPRIMSVTLNSNPKTVLISCYAPTEQAISNEKDQLYEHLNGFIDILSPRVFLILLGDFNAHIENIGQDSHRTSPRVVSRYTYHTSTNNNGQRLVNRCEFCNIQSVLLKRPQPPGHQWTWEHAEGSKSQLDHIMLRGKWINSLQSWRAYSTIELDSDHRILTARLKLSLRTTRKPG